MEKEKLTVLWDKIINYFEPNTVGTMSNAKKVFVLLARDQGRGYKELEVFLKKRGHAMPRMKTFLLTEAEQVNFYKELIS